MAMDSDKELQQVKNRFKELAEKSYRENVYTFSSFLGLSEQDLFWQIEREISYAGYKFWGGSEDTDRKIVRFGKSEEFGYEEEYPITCIHMKPFIAKFSDAFSHRDFLGALMNLGIERSTIGDISVGEKEGYLFCTNTIAEYICDNLTKVKHTNIKCEIVNQMADIPRQEPKEERVLVSSARIDGVIAKVYNVSRSESIDLFRSKKIYVNGRLNENNSQTLKQKDVVNVRGYGKFIYEGVEYETKKGKSNILIRIFR